MDIIIKRHANGRFDLTVSNEHSDVSIYIGDNGRECGTSFFVSTSHPRAEEVRQGAATIKSELYLLAKVLRPVIEETLHVYAFARVLQEALSPRKR